ncbi:MAG: PilZ domain-containing protein [Nitrospinota bacterium]
MKHKADETKVERVLIGRDFSFEPKVPIGEVATIEWKNTKYRTIMRGVLLQKYFLIDIPVEIDGSPVKFDYNSILRFHFIIEGMVYGLRVCVLSAHSEAGILVLEYPSQAGRFNLRESQRVRVTIPAFIITHNFKDLTDCAVVDISRAGARIVIDELVSAKKKEWAMINFVLPNGNSVETLEGIVRSVEHVGKHKHMGISFDAKNDIALNTIGDFCDECASYADAETHAKTKMFEAGQSVTIEFSKKKVKTSIRGWKWEQSGYLLIEPPIEAMPEGFKPGVVTIVRFKKGGKSFGIATRFIANLKKTGLWVFEFQEDIVEFSFRTNERLSCMIPVSIYESRKDRTAQIGNGMILDISLGGVRLVTKKTLHVSSGDGLGVSFNLCDSEVIDRQVIELKRTGMINGFYEYAGSFVELGVEEEEKIKKLFEFCIVWMTE